MPNESVAEFMAELRRLATQCEFGMNLDDSLRDRLVCGLRSSRKLLTKADLTLKKALDLAVSMEAHQIPQWIRAVAEACWTFEGRHFKSQGQCW